MARPALLSAQFLVFIAGGALSALVDIGLMQVLLLRGAGSLAAASGGFLAGLLVNYAFHARVTFNSLTSAATLLRFLCLVALNYLITIALVGAAQALGGAALLGKLVSLPLVAINGFYLGRRWIFKPRGLEP
ncbi:MAG: GtrA family protein [Massilia sp.]